jgi:hypothetical protein
MQAQRTVFDLLKGGCCARSDGSFQVTFTNSRLRSESRWSLGQAGFDFCKRSKLATVIFANLLKRCVTAEVSARIN